MHYSIERIKTGATEMTPYDYFGTFNGCDETIDGYTMGDYEEYCAQWHAYRDSEPPSFEQMVYWRKKWDAEYESLWESYKGRFFEGLPPGVRELEYWNIA